MLSLGYYLDPYFPARPGWWDYNRLQNGVDASLVVIYLAALLATIAADYFDESVLNSIWIVALPLLAMPAFIVGYSLRLFSKAKFRELIGIGAYTPLMSEA